MALLKFFIDHVNIFSSPLPVYKKVKTKYLKADKNYTDCKNPWGPSKKDNNYGSEAPGEFVWE